MNHVQALDWAAFAPIAVPVVAVMLIIVVDAIRPDAPELRRVHDLITLAGLVGSGVAIAWLALDGGGTRETLCVPGGGLVLRACSFVVSPLTLTLQAIVVIGAVGCVLLTLDGPAARNRTPHHVLLLIAVTGALALGGARDLASLVVALEMASLPAVGLVALRRDAPGAQAGVTLLLTAVGSLGLLLLGTAMLLLSTGSLHLSRIDAALSQPGLPSQVRMVAVLGVLLAASGIGFKLSAVPFHLWTPDTYAGAPMPIAAFLAVVSKTAGLAALVVLLLVGVPALASTWAPVIGVVAAVTVTVGNLVALRQTVAIRLLAWSTVAQAGWVLLPLAGAVKATPSAMRAAAAGSIGYLAAYAAASLAAFAVVIVLARHHPAGEEHSLSSYRGLARREPVAAAVLGFALLCLAGLPPGVVGLVAKLIAIRPLVDASSWALAVVAAANVALGVVYYLRWAALLVSRPEGATPMWRVTAAEGLALGGAGALIVALSVAPQAIAGLLPAVLR